MAPVTVRYFASIREKLGRSEDRLEVRGAETVLAIWQRVSEHPWLPNTLVAVNQEYATPEALVRAGDEVAFFPPVTGG